MAHSAPDIFSYLDYRQYLTDVVEYWRKQQKGFSLREFARLAGSSSPNYYQLVTSRRLNIGSTNVTRLSKHLGLEKREIEYFRTIIAFDHAKTTSEKDRQFHRILRNKEYRSIKTLTKKQYELFAYWYLPVVRELVVRPDYTGNPSWISSRIVPAVREHQAAKSIETLRGLGLIRESSADPSRFEHTEKVISTPAQVLSVAVAKYHRTMISLGAEAIDRFSSKERDIRSVTLSLSKKQFGEIQQRQEVFWKEVLDLSAQQGKVGDRVYQLNVQLFPVTKRSKKGRRT